MRRIPLVVLAVLGVAAITVGTASAAMQESVRGHYSYGVGNYVDISAKASLLNTNASGSFKYTFSGTDPNEVFYGSVTCVIVGPARTATVGGVITRIEPPGVFTNFQGFLISVQDTGSGSNQLTPDLTSSPQFLSTPPPACTFQFPPFMFPITAGDITVDPVK